MRPKTFRPTEATAAIAIGVRRAPESRHDGAVVSEAAGNPNVTALVFIATPGRRMATSAPADIEYWEQQIRLRFQRYDVDFIGEIRHRKSPTSWVAPPLWSSPSTFPAIPHGSVIAIQESRSQARPRFDSHPTRAAGAS
jgi:hypothetical protein